ncbi:MAG: CBS domain-containing protein [Candidatus Helarchaeota archaeon]|nr:CBS domain-containing protein [Candidatus Helarchaeota archaeon]
MFQNKKENNPKSDGLTETPILTGDKSLYEIFLCYFDEARGHLTLYTYPEYLKKDQNQEKIIKIHSIWFLDTEFQENLDHVDLEYGDRIYLAMKFSGESYRKKSRSGMDEKTPETYVLMLSLPKDYSFLGADLLVSLYSKIKALADRLYILIQKEHAVYKVVKSAKDRTIIKEGKVIEKELYNISKTLLPRISADAISSLASATTKKNEKLAYLLFHDMSRSSVPSTPRQFDISKIGITEDKTEYFKRIAMLTKIELIENRKKIKVAVKNVSLKDLYNIKIEISQVQEFFETSHWETSIDTWFAGEELVFQYPISDLKNHYIFEINSTDRKILVKEIQPQRLIPKEESFFERILVNEFMDNNPLTISYSAKISDAVKLMNSEKSDYLLVTLGEKPIGIITNRDILRKLIRSCLLRRDADPNKIQCKDIMSSPIKVLNVNDNIRKAAMMVLQHDIKKLPVLDDGHLVGIIRHNDIINIYLSQRLEEEEETNFGEIRNLGEKTVDEIMIKDVQKLSTNQNIATLLDILFKKKIGSVLITENGKAVGIITERDIMREIIEKGKDPRTTKIHEIMSSPLVTISPKTKISEANEIMITKDFRYLPIASDHDPSEIIGIVSSTDILRLDIKKAESAY